MSYNQGLDFRSLSTYGDGIDPVGYDYVIASRGLYPWTTAQGNTVGWETTAPDYYEEAYQDTIYGEQRLAGNHLVSAGHTRTFRLDLPAAGTYTITLAIGGGSYAVHGTVTILDTAATLATIGPLSEPYSSPGWYDAAGNYWVGTNVETGIAAWQAGQTSITVTTTTTILRFQLAASANYLPLAHIFVSAASGGGSATGTLAVTESGDTLSAAASATVKGTLTATQAAQTLSAVGTVGSATTAALASTQAAQTLSAVGKVAVSGALAAAQAAQALSASGAVAVSGALATTQAAQTLSAVGTVGSATTAALAATQAAQTLSAVGKVAVAGTLAATQAAQTLSSAGAVAVSGTLTATQAAQTLSSAGAVAVSGTLASAQAAQTLSSAGAVAVSGTLASAQAAQTLSAVGKAAVAGTLTATQAAQTLSAAGTAAVSGTLTATQAAQTLSSAGAVAVSGTLASAQAAQTLSSAGVVTAPLGPITGYLAAVQQPNWSPPAPPGRRGVLQRGPLLYVRSPQPPLPGGAPAYIQQELGLVQQSAASISSYSPQPATAAPLTPQDATVRLARKPWWPVAGQTADAWVYYDAAGGLWRLLGTNPTST